MIRIRIIRRERVFGSICLWHMALGLRLLTRHPRLGDYLPSCLRSSLGRHLVLRREGNLGHRLQGRLGRHLPESSVRGLTGHPVRSGAGCSRSHVPNHPNRNLTRHPTGNRDLYPLGHLLDYEARCPYVTTGVLFGGFGDSPEKGTRPRGDARNASRMCPQQLRLTRCGTVPIRPGFASPTSGLELEPCGLWLARSALTMSYASQCPIC